jgi:hypothetical protein
VHQGRDPKNLRDVQTLEDLFPGATGKLQVARIILRYGMPELARIRRDEPLDRALVDRLLACKREMSGGAS